MKILPGSRWKSAVCDTEVVVVKPPKEAGALECGGVAMLAMSAERPGGGAVSPEHSGGTLLGKRYGHERVGIEVLCTKGGQGSMSFGGHALEFRASKPLPSSD